MSNVLRTIEIEGKTFEIRKPVMRQKVAVIELMKQYGVDYQRYVELGIMLNNEDDLSTADYAELALFQTITETNPDFCTGLAAIMLVERGTKFSESFDANKELIADWYMDAEDTEGIDISTFFMLTRTDTKVVKKAIAGTG